MRPFRSLALFSVMLPLSFFHDRRTWLQSFVRCSTLLTKLAAPVSTSQAFLARMPCHWGSSRERGFAIGVYTAGEFGGLAIFAPVLALILANWGWPAMFAI